MNPTSAKRPQRLKKPLQPHTAPISMELARLSFTNTSKTRARFYSGAVSHSPASPSARQGRHKGDSFRHTCGTRIPAASCSLPQNMAGIRRALRPLLSRQRNNAEVAEAAGREMPLPTTPAWHPQLARPRHRAV